MQKNIIIILDFGSQYTQLIARRVRDLGVYCEIHPYNANFKDIVKNYKVIGYILSGGPSSFNEDNAPKISIHVLESNVPILGICYGMQAMAAQLGGKVSTCVKKEFGKANINILKKTDLFSDIADDCIVWMSHGDMVEELPKDFHVICSTTNTPISGMQHNNKPWYGLQFHPEVTHTQDEDKILNNFIFKICNATINWNPESILENSLKFIKDTVGDEEVLLGLSGGLDSTVVAFLLEKAIGKKLTCMFINTGMLRLNEVEEIQKLFAQYKDIKIITIDASGEFLKALKNISCPEKKRKVVGHVFIEVFSREAKKLSNIKWLAQGTIYPDVIESAGHNFSGVSETIKSHHNVGGLPKDMPFKLLEPIKLLFKDEVRQLGKLLGLDKSILYRHPFPGPGLAVRVLGEITSQAITILQQADAIFIKSLKEANLYYKVSQAFAVFLPIKSVGVMGDGRRYDFVIALRAVETTDFMTAKWAHLPWEFLEDVSTKIINEVPGVSRVVYDISGKPPATIEWE